MWTKKSQRIGSLQRDQVEEPTPPSDLEGVTCRRQTGMGELSSGAPKVQPADGSLRSESEGEERSLVEAGGSGQTSRHRATQLHWRDETGHFLSKVTHLKHHMVLY